MKFINLNKIIIILFFITALLLLATPINELFHLSQKLKLEHFYDLFNNSAQIRNHIKEFVTESLLIGLLSLVLLSTLMMYWFNRKTRWAKNTVLFILCFLLLGGLGPYYCQFGKYPLYEIAANLNNSEKGSVVAIVQFKDFPEDFKQYLEQALKGEIKCSMSTHFVFNGEGTPIKVNNKINIKDRDPIPLPTDILQSILTKQQLKFELALQESQSLIYRDLNKILKNQRQDQILINKKLVSIPKAQGLLIYFKFHDKKGKPIAVFL